MWKWLGKLRFWKQTKPQGPIVHHYGQYLYKPVIARALSEVMGISQSDVVFYVLDPQTPIYLNGEKIEGAEWTRRRLESGSYEIKLPSQNKVWTFFIG